MEVFRKFSALGERLYFPEVVKSHAHLIRATSWSKLFALRGSPQFLSLTVSTVPYLFGCKRRFPLSRNKSVL